MPACMIFTRKGPIIDQVEMDLYSVMNRSHAARFSQDYRLHLCSYFDEDGV